jgi:hypothetical protein
MLDPGANAVKAERVFFIGPAGVADRDANLSNAFWRSSLAPFKNDQGSRPARRPLSVLWKRPIIQLVASSELTAPFNRPGPHPNSGLIRGPEKPPWAGMIFASPASPVGSFPEIKWAKS